MLKEIDMSVKDTIDMDAVFAQFIRDQFGQNNSKNTAQSSHKEVLSK